MVEELKARIRELETEVERLRNESPVRLFEHVPYVVVAVDCEGRIIGFNDAALAHFGSVVESSKGQGLHVLFDDETGPALQQLCVSTFIGAGDSVVRQRDGTVMGFSIARANADNTFVLLQDQSRREQLEAELRYARRMASVGRLAAEVAHEMNNPLAVIQGRLEMLKSLPDMPVGTRERHLGIVEEHSQRVARIIQNLQLFARPRVPRPKTVSLLEQLDAAVMVLGRRLDRVVVVLNIPRDLAVFVDPEQGAIVWENLLASVAAITPAGQDLIVEVVEEKDGAVHLRICSTMGAWSDEILTNLRSPYEGGRHRVDPMRGLALTISWGIIQDHGGWMTARNEPEERASIELFFPGKVRSTVRDLRPATQSLPSRDVLVVDDDAIMAETVSWMLSTFGHRVVVVHTAEAALEQLDVDVFHLILSDHRLPGMDGETLLGIVHERWPEMSQRTILTSGLLHRPAEGQRYLQKPFSRDQLAVMLAQIFGE